MRDFDDFLKDKVDIRGSNLGRGEHFNLNGRMWKKEESQLAHRLSAWRCQGLRPGLNEARALVECLSRAAGLFSLTHS